MFQGKSILVFLMLDPTVVTVYTATLRPNLNMAHGASS
jgi:hypothetical protein